MSLTVFLFFFTAAVWRFLQILLLFSPFVPFFKSNAGDPSYNSYNVAKWNFKDESVNKMTVSPWAPWVTEWVSRWRKPNLRFLKASKDTPKIYIYINRIFTIVLFVFCGWKDNKQMVKAQFKTTSESCQRFSSKVGRHNKSTKQHGNGARRVAIRRWEKVIPIKNRCKRYNFIRKYS